MIYILLALVLLLAIVLVFVKTPDCHFSHASRAAINAFADGDMPSNHKFHNIPVDAHGVPISNKFVGCAVGDSMEEFGIVNGARYLGDYVTDGETQLSSNQVVVIDAVAKYHPNIKYRLRRIKSIENGMMSFYDTKGDTHGDRPVNQALAVVTHLLH